MSVETQGTWTLFKILTGMCKKRIHNTLMQILATVKPLSNNHLWKKILEEPFKTFVSAVAFCAVLVSETVPILQRSLSLHDEAKS